MALSNKLVEIMIFSGVMTVWNLFFLVGYEQIFSDGNFGIGEMYLGFTIPAVIAAILSYFVIKRIQANR